MIMTQIALNSIWLVVAGLIINLVIHIHKKNICFDTFASAFSGIIVACLTYLIHFLYYSPRPFVGLGITPSIITYDLASFPSGHTAFLAAIGISVLMKSRKWGIVILVTALVTGFARVYAGIHWPSDILVGFGFGLVVGYIITKFIEPRIIARFKKKRLK